MQGHGEFEKVFMASLRQGDDSIVRIYLFMFYLTTLSILQIIRHKC